MFQWLTVVETLGYILIFPGFLFCFLVGLLLAGIDRKIVAKMQKRVGPPVLQPFYDFFKLCGIRCWGLPRSSCCRCSSPCSPSPRFPRWLT